MEMAKHAVAFSNNAQESATITNERGMFTYGNDTIVYDVIRKLKPTESTGGQARKAIIKVHPDLRVVVTVPNDASEDAIHEAIQKRARWIWKSIAGFTKQKDTVSPKRYVSGETQFYLGRRYVLKVMVDAEQLPNVKLSRGKLNVTIKREVSKDCDKRLVEIKPLIDKWYKQKAKAIFHERLAVLLPKANWVSGIPSFRLMAMTKQWGSCSTNGNLILNPHLVKAPKECIDYVILHELCHIAEHNHSERFWRLLTQVMPNWQEVKAKLDEMAEMYLNE
ncbi:M48 family metallopeptidase [Planctobacterium marinum]|uniref:M48 family metallopeptidase n=1 Tax=Planctobacterium marinum TaxID=1631968 RepID=UPI001E54DA72|nr:SprT family zinc-dependent metalloprotease [Planctobacterium marinum]MCC2607921.1 M48 family metallopeptidase [Planctobacterium marinum]